MTPEALGGLARRGGRGRRRFPRPSLPGLSVPVRTAIVATLVAGVALVAGLVAVEEGLRSVRGEALRQDAGGYAMVLSRGMDQRDVARRGLGAVTYAQLHALLPPDVLFEVTDETGRVALASPELAPFRSGGGAAAFHAVDPDGSLGWLGDATTAAGSQPSLPQPSLPTTVRGTDVVELPGRRAGDVTVFVPVGLLVTPHVDTRLLLVGVPVTLVLVAALVWGGAHLALRPVRRMRARAATISAEDLGLRVPVPPGRHAVADLGHTLNGMLDRLQAADSRQRRFVADAAHELRSPIASLRAVLDVANAHPGRTDWAATVHDAAAETRRLERLTEDLLLLARLEARAPTPEGVVDLAELVRGEVRRHPGRDGVRLAVAGSPAALVPGSEARFERLVRNLLDNAVRHARSLVEVEVTAGDGTARLSVRDDGPGIPPERREHVFERFTRLDEGRDRDAGGTGLGLSIVRAIAEGSGGRVEVADGAPGALLVVELPSAVAAP
jgi:signal transduction histidine kinase